MFELQLASMRELDAMSQALAAICEGEPSEILQTLASRETVLGEIAARQSEIASASDGDAVGMLAEIREQIESIAMIVKERDEKTLGVIMTRRDELLADLKSVDRSREAVRAYGPDQRDRRRFRDDSA